MTTDRKEPAWMRELRSRARERFDAMSWPTTSDEEWRRTDVSGIDALSYLPAPAAAGSMSPGASGPSGFAGSLKLEAGRRVELSIADAWKNSGVRLLSLDEALEEFEKPLSDIFDEGIDAADNRFSAWHYATWSHGAFLVVPAGLEIPEPFLIDFMERGSGVLSSPHVVVVLGEAARASVIQRIDGDPEAADERILCNAGIDLILSDAAGLQYYEAQHLGPQSLYFRHARTRGGRDSTLRHFDAALGARLVKTRIDCGLAGRGSEAYLNGVYFCREGQHMDIRTVQRHHSPSATSRAYYKGAVASGGRTVFQGLIEVDPGASGTDAYLTNRNLVLGDGARSDSIPTLRIGNNDVRCSHGSTTGRLSEEELFYLESRGLSRNEAREMLVMGYFEDLLDHAPEIYREGTLERIRSRLALAA
jgi:Fe-S cluster assembly protein SufD